MKLTAQQESILHVGAIWSSGIVEQIADALYHFIWAIGVNQTVTPLYTSDNPVAGTCLSAVNTAIVQTHGDSVASLRLADIFDFRANNAVQVAMPLTPKLVLLMSNPTYYAALQPQQGKAFQLSTEHVRKLNSVQTVLASRHVFSSTDDFAVARRALSNRSV